MRKLLFTTAIITMAMNMITVVQAQDAAQEAGSFAGLYGGLEVGYEGYTFDNLNELNAGGLSYGGLLGYRFQLSPSFLLGVEGKAGGDGASKNVGIIEVSSGLNWSVSGIMGIMVGNNLVFASLGYGETNLRASTMGLSLSSYEGGLRAGLGMEFKLGEKTGIRLSGQWQDFDQAYSLGASLGLIFQF